MKPMVFITPAQSAVLLAAYHTLDEIVSAMEKHNAEHLSSCACLTAARDELYHALIEDDTVLWDSDAVVMNERANEIKNLMASFGCNEHDAFLLRKIAQSLENKGY